MMAIASATEVVHSALSRVRPFEPFLTRAEVCKVGVSHFMSIAEARKDLGYHLVVPYERAVERTAAHFSSMLISRQQRTLLFVSFLVLVSIFITVVFLFLLS
jgi:hypothetical protein